MEKKRQQKHTKAYQSICIFYSHMLHFALNVIKSHPFWDDIIKSESAPTVMYCITACLTNIHRRRTHQHHLPITRSTTVCLYKVGKERKELSKKRIGKKEKEEKITAACKKTRQNKEKKQTSSASKPSSLQHGINAAMIINTYQSNWSIQIKHAFYLFKSVLKCLNMRICVCCVGGACLSSIRNKQKAKCPQYSWMLHVSL